MKLSNMAHRNILFHSLQFPRSSSLQIGCDEFGHLFQNSAVIVNQEPTGSTWDMNRQHSASLGLQSRIASESRLFPSGIASMQQALPGILRLAQRHHRLLYRLGSFSLLETKPTTRCTRPRRSPEKPKN
jgi:hypothetical protein